MAVVKMGQVKTTLHRSIAYIINPSKTEGGTLVSANYTEDVADPVRMADAMLESLDKTAGGRREDGVLAHHVIQSFSPEDSRTLTPRQVHELGVAFADEITGGEYQYVIATHVDREHLHNHIVICAANTSTRHKMRVRRDTLGRWRAVSDRLCVEHGLDVLPERTGPELRRESDPPHAGETDGGMPPARHSMRTERHGVTLAELYASAKGDAVKDRIRLAIDAAASAADGFDAFARELRRGGVTVSVRGRHLTFTDAASGMRVRDVRLGRAYDEANIMARIGSHAVAPISFNRKMIAERSDGALRVWLPGSHRRLSMTIPMMQVVRDGETYRAYLPAGAQHVVVDRRGRYALRLTSDGLYEYFARPPARLETAVRDRPFMPGKSEAQRRWYLIQARRLDQLQDMADELSAAGRLARRDVSLEDAIADIRGRIAVEREAFQAALVAFSEPASPQDVDGTTIPKDEVQDADAPARTNASASSSAPDNPIYPDGNQRTPDPAELRLRERRLDRLAHELDILQRLKARARRHEGQPRHVRQPE